MIVSSGSSYPWDSISLVTDAYTADARYIDNVASPGVWAPSKGQEPFVQSTPGKRLVYSETYGSGNKGGLTSDGVDDWMSADGLATKVSNSGAYTIISSLEVLTLTHAATAWGFGASGGTDHINLLQMYQDPSPLFWRTAYYDNVGNQRISNSDYTPTIARVVITVLMGGTNPGQSVIRVNGVARTMTIATIPSSPGITDADYTKFTLGAFRNAAIVQPIHAIYRALIFAPAILSAASVASIENYLIAEAA